MSKKNTCIRVRPEACNFIKKETLAQVLSCEFCEISKKMFLIFLQNTSGGCFCHTASNRFQKIVQHHRLGKRLKIRKYLHELYRMPVLKKLKMLRKMLELRFSNCILLFCGMFLLFFQKTISQSSSNYL